jgi:hypothetical protein
MKYIYPSLIAIAVIIIIYLWFREDGKSQIVYSHDEEKIAQHIKEIAKIKDRTIALKNKMTSDSLLNLEREKKHIAQITSLKKQIAAKKSIPTVQTVLNENHDVGELVHFYDSAIVELEHERDSLKEDLAEQHVDFTGLLSACEAELTLRQGMDSIRIKEISDLMKQNKKLRRQNRVLKVLIPVAVIGGVAIGL